MPFPLKNGAILREIAFFNYKCGLQIPEFVKQTCRSLVNKFVKFSFSCLQITLSFQSRLTTLSTALKTRLRNFLTALKPTPYLLRYSATSHSSTEQKSCTSRYAIITSTGFVAFWEPYWNIFTDPEKSSSWYWLQNFTQTKIWPQTNVWIGGKIYNMTCSWQVMTGQNTVVSY